MDAPIVSGSGGRNSPGYVLFGVLIGITLMGIGMSAAVHLWSQAVQREREAELLFRGEAIVRGLERFQEDRPGTLPESLDDLVEGKYLRQAWLDPMTGESFLILRAEARTAAAGPATGADDGSAPTNPAGEEERERARETRRSARTISDREDDGIAGRITGVVSTSDLLSFRSYEGAQRYSEWRFEAQVGGTAGGEAGGEARGEGPGEIPGRTAGEERAGTRRGR